MKTVLIILASIAGLLITSFIVIAIVIKNKKMNCPKCHAPGFEDGVYCSKCGWQG